MSRVYPLVMATALALLTSAAYAADVPFDSLPAAVKAAALREIGDGQILDVEHDQKRGQTIFEIEFSHGGVKWELDIAVDGTLLSKTQD